MRTMFALAMMVAGGCDGGACTFNSECATGSYCSMGACVQDCSPSMPCAAGLSCNDFGQCIADDVDAGRRIDAGRDAGRALDAGRELDAGSAEPDGGMDGGHDTGTDAGNDAGPLDEACTPSTVGSIAADEDRDGEIDEGCPFYFGLPHPVIAIHREAVEQTLAPWLSPDGLRLYFSSRYTSPTQRVYMAERPSIGEPFGPPSAIRGLESTFAWAITLSSDEREAYIEVSTGATQQIHRATRASLGAPFDPPVLVAASDVSGRTENHPFLSADGLELIFEVRGVGLHRLTRATTADEFTGTPEPLVIPGTERTTAATLTPGGRTLLYTRLDPVEHLYIAERTSGATFGTPTAAASIQMVATDTVSIPFYSAATRELWFGSNRPWSPTSYSMWRVEVCRDGPCPDRAIACAPPDLRSPDGVSCYRLGESAMSWPEARDACGSGHLASLHSAAEMNLVWSSFSSAAPWLWMGGYDDMGDVAECHRSRTCPWAWTSGEPWIRPLWSESEPSDSVPEEDCLMLRNGAGFGDAPCGDAQRFVCEDDGWPVW